MVNSDLFLVLLLFLASFWYAKVAYQYGLYGGVTE